MTLTVLTLNEKPRLEWRKQLTDVFRDTGDWTVYALPPCIILGESSLYDREIPIGSGIYRCSAEPEWTGYASVLPVIEGVLPQDAENPGLFLSLSQEAAAMDRDITVSVRSAALIEADGTSFRILRQRPLKRDREP